MPKLLGKRDYSEHDVIPEFSYSGTYPVNCGTFVTIAGSGLVLNANPLALAGGFQTFNGVLSERWTIPQVVTNVTSTGDKVLGMLLYDGREVDENGEKIVWNPRKQAEMGVFISGQNAPVVSKGKFRYSGVIGQPNPGDILYVTPQGGGQLSTTGEAFQRVGRALSVKDSGNGTIYFSLTVY